MKKLLFTIIFLLTLCVNGFGTTYYVSRAGNNTVGTSWATAWSDTIYALDSLAAHMSGGDTCFLGAGTWTSTNDIAVICPPTGGTYTDKTVYACSAYVRGLATVTGKEYVSGFTLHSGNIYKAAIDPICATAIIYTVGSGSNDTLYGKVDDVSSLTSGGLFCTQNDTLYIYPYTDTAAVKFSSRFVFDLPTDAYDHVVIRDLNINFGNKRGIKLGNNGTNPDSVYIKYCNVSHVSGQTGDNPWGIGMYGAGSDTLNYGYHNYIVACSVSNIRVRESWTGHSKCICIYAAMYNVVESCYTNGSSYGILFKGNWPNGTDMKGNVIRYNECVNGSIGFTSFNQSDSIYGNIVRDFNASLGGSGWGINVEGAGMDSSCRIYNNTIYNFSKPFVLAGLDGEGLDGDSTSLCATRDHWFKYNVISFGGTEDAVIWGNIDIDDSNAICFDSNYYYQGGRNITIRNIGSFTAWQALGQDVYSVVADPGLNENYEPTNISAWDNPITYGGRTWYGHGAVQTLWEEDEFDIVHSLSSYYVTDSSVQIIDNYSGITVDSVDTLILYIDTNNAIADWIDTIKISSGFTDPDTLVYATGLTAGETYYCWVAIDSSGVRDTSSSISFTTQSASITHSLTVTDTSISSFKVSNDYSGYGSAVIDTIELIYDDETDIADPLGIIKNGTGITDPDDLEVTGLNDNTWYYFWFVLKLYDTKDTSDIDSIQTLTQEEYNDTSFTRTVEQGSDDAKVYGSNIDITAVDAVIGNTSGGGSCSFAVRFTDIIVPQGAIIDSAYLTLISNATGSTENVDCIISMEDTADASTFSATYSEYSTRHITSATVAWDNVEAWTSGSSYNTPDFKTSFQELVDRLDWEAGNACVVFVRDNSSTTDNFRRIRTYENGSTPKLATLVVGYHIESEEETAHYCNRYKSNNKYGLNRYNRKD